MSAIEDTPDERDAKADALEVAAEVEADRLAAELRRFRWEVRTYILVLIALVVIKTL